ncbi:hypothetical protein O181_065230 [Austropuccinia psidii MF-1]|uniref:Uncharacterized protein n=1 Tax=Austropuccinia psidii MF-1 TaxID=1389203 RepID=A0A9Q3EUP4_9BASI|nr:hypothetical protein [Austropuccinia psidii MF-1]
MGNFSKPLAGGHEILLTHKELYGSGEDHSALRRMESLVLQEKVKKINNWLNKQSLLSIDQKKELEITPALNKEGPVVSTSSKPTPEQHKDKPKGPEKKQRGLRNNQGKGKGKANWHRLYPKGYKIPKLIPSAMENVFNMEGTLMELTAKKQVSLNSTFTHK